MDSGGPGVAGKVGGGEVVGVTDGGGVGVAGSNVGRTVSNCGIVGIGARLAVGLGRRLWYEIPKKPMMLLMLAKAARMAPSRRRAPEIDRNRRHRCWRR